MAYRYYSIMRPLDLGTYPNWNGRGDNPVIDVVNFDQRTKVQGVPRLAWGYVDYMYPLTSLEKLDYELYERRW